MGFNIYIGNISLNYVALQKQKAKVAQLMPSESRWGTSADRVEEGLVARVEDGIGEDILGKVTLEEAVGVEVFDKDEDEAAAVDLVTWDDNVGAGPITWCN